MPLYAPFPGFATAPQVRAGLVSDLAVSPASLFERAYGVATKAANQTGLTTAAFNKILLDTAAIDNAAWFDTGTSRLTPTSARPVVIEWTAAVGAGLTNSLVQSAIFKNGSLFRQGTTCNFNGGAVSFTSLLDTPNGATDYYEFYVYAVEATPGSLVYSTAQVGATWRQS